MCVHHLHKNRVTYEGWYRLKDKPEPWRLLGQLSVDACNPWNINAVADEQGKCGKFVVVNPSRYE